MTKLRNDWMNRLTAAPARLELPIDQAHSELDGEVRLRLFPFPLPDAAISVFSEWEVQQGLTRKAILLTAFQTLLLRCSGQAHFVIGTAVQDAKGTGYWMPLGADLTGLSFAEAVAQAAELLREGAELAELVDTGQSGQQVMFQFGTQLEEAEATELSLRITASDAGWQGEFRYAAGLFSRGRVEQLAANFCTLLEGAAETPDTRLTHLPLLSERERARLLVEWNDTSRPFVTGIGIQELFAAQVQRMPERVAAEFAGQEISYRELDLLSNRLAHRLRAQGAGAGMCVGLCVDRSLRMLVGMLGILKAGAAYVPLDPNFPQQRLAYMIEVSEMTLIVTEEKLARTVLSDVETKRLCLDQVLQETQNTQETSGEQLPTSAPEDAAYVIFTSGSTGQPKGVQVPHRAVVNFLQTMQELPGITADDTVLAVTTLSFDIAVYELFLPLVTGARLVIVPRETAADGRLLDLALQASEATILQATPATYRLLLEAGWSGHDRLKILCCGEAMLPELAEQLLARCGSLWNMYGPTEATVYATGGQVLSSQGPVSIGRPIGNMDAYILDECLQPVPVGVPGELFVGGAGLALGYVQRPDLTEEKFVPHPFRAEPGAKLYRTGDLVKWREDGVIDYLGRLDHQVKIRGFRIEIGEIEAVLEAHHRVRGAVVTAQEDKLGHKRLIAYVQSDGTEEETAQELRSHVQAALPGYMVPAAIVVLAAFPLTGSGKIDRHKLPAPERKHFEARSEYVAPTTEEQRVLAEMFAEVLGLDRIGIEDNLLLLGLDSLQAAKGLARIRDRFLTEVALQTLFEHPTIAGLAEQLQGVQAELDRPIPVAAKAGDLPLSFAQQRLWFLDQMEPGVLHYNMPQALKIRGAVSRPALEQALVKIVKRHDVLRTVFANRDGQGVQKIDGAASLQLKTVEAGSQDEAWNLLLEAVQRPFDLERGPMFEATLYSWGEQEHALLLNMHHIVSDDWSLDVLYRELGAFYRAALQGTAAEVPELSVQYADYAVWQRGQWTGERLEQEADFWKKQLADAPLLLELPTDRPRPAVQSRRGDVFSFVVPDALRDGLKTLSRQEGSTLYMTLLAAFQVLLSRYSGQEDVVVGTAHANRSRTEVEPLIGFFVNMLAMRTDLSGEPSFVQVLERVRRMSLLSFAHSELPFDKVVEEVQPVRNLSHNPIVQVTFQLQNVQVQLPALPEAQVEKLELPNSAVQFDLSLHMTDEEDGLCGKLEYSTDLFDRATMERLMELFVTVLEEIVQNPQVKIGEIALVKSEERERLLAMGQGLKTAVPALPIHEQIAVQAKRTPDAPAVRFAEQVLTYAELDAQAERLAGHLRSRGVERGRVVGVQMERSPEMATALLAIWKAGGAYLPLDPSNPQERLAYILEDAGADVLVTRESVLAQLSDAAEVEVTSGTDMAVEKDDPAYLIYTSGSTGQPKGVVIPHGAIANHMAWMLEEFRFTEQDRVLQKTPFSFDASVWEFWAPLLCGGELVFAEPGGHQDPSYLIRTIQSQGITTLQTVPVLLRMLLEAEEFAACTTLRQVFCGGDVLTAEQARRFADVLPAAELVNLYGPTENTIDTTFWRSTCSSAQERVPIGRPIHNVSLYLLDQRLELVPAGATGELYIGGAGLAIGYHNRLELTGAAFVPSPFVKGERLYKSGDWCRWRADGELEYVGRLDHQVKMRGFRVETGEIEAALKELEPVREAAVLVVPDAAGEIRLAAFVEGDELKPEELRLLLLERLPEYMVPALWTVLERLPLSPSGKVDRRALPEPDWQALRREYTAPRTETERVLAAVWQEVLQVEPIGVDDHFFELGGHSLLAVQVLSRVRDALRVELPLRTMFEAPTVAAMSAAVDAVAWALTGMREEDVPEADFEEGEI